VTEADRERGEDHLPTWNMMATKAVGGHVMIVVVVEVASMGGKEHEKRYKEVGRGRRLDLGLKGRERERERGEREVKEVVSEKIGD
jgi:hypothetical protein